MSIRAMPIHLLQSSLTYIVPYRARKLNPTSRMAKQSSRNTEKPFKIAPSNQIPHRNPQLLAHSTKPTPRPPTSPDAAIKILLASLAVNMTWLTGWNNTQSIPAILPMSAISTRVANTKTLIRFRVTSSGVNQIKTIFGAVEVNCCVLQWRDIHRRDTW